MRDDGRRTMDEGRETRGGRRKIKMRLMALRACGFVLPSIHSSMIRAFQSLGVEVCDLAVPQNSNLIRTIKDTGREGYDAVFTMDLGANHDFISNLKDLQLSIRIPWIIWFVDDPEGYKFPEACEPTLTLPFCWDNEIVQKSISLSRMTLRHLPLATDPSLFYKEQENGDFHYPGGVFVGNTRHPNELLDLISRTTPELPGEAEALWEIYREDFRQPLHDLAWIGLRRKINQPLEVIKTDPFCRLWVNACVYQLGIRKRKDVVSRVVESAGAVFGDEGWRDILANGLYRGWVRYGEELRKIYNHSSFILDVRQPQSRTGLSQRVFDASACGTPVITEWSPEIENLFDPEEELLCFRHSEEAREMKERCLQDPDKAHKMGEKARKRVLAHHTYRHRAEQILQALHAVGGREEGA